MILYCRDRSKLSPWPSSPPDSGFSTGNCCWVQLAPHLKQPSTTTDLERKCLTSWAAVFHRNRASAHSLQQFTAYIRTAWRYLNWIWSDAWGPPVAWRWWRPIRCNFMRTVYFYLFSQRGVLGNRQVVLECIIHRALLLRANARTCLATAPPLVGCGL